MGGVSSATPPAEVSPARSIKAEPPSPAVRALLLWSKRVTLAAWVAIIGLVVWGFQSGVLTSVTRLREVMEGFGVAAPVVYALVGAGEAVFPVFPGSATIIAAPILFGPVVGFVAAYAATCLGSTVVFLLSRHVGADLLFARFRPSTVERYLGWLGHRSFTKWFAIAIAMPVAPDDLLCYLAGLSTMRLRTFLLIVLLLKPWALILYSFGVITALRHLFPWIGL